MLPGFVSGKLKSKKKKSERSEPREREWFGDTSVFFFCLRETFILLYLQCGPVWLTKVVVAWLEHAASTA